MNWLYRAGLVAVLFTAAALRFAGIDWDAYQHHHPDERYITWVASTIEFPSTTASWIDALDPTESTFNPFRWPAEASSEGIVVLQDEPRDFAYGHLPLYLGVIVTRVVERFAPILTPLAPAEWRLAGDILNTPGRVEFQHLTVVSRALTIMIDVATVWLTYLLGMRLHSRAVGLLAAALLAVSVLHIQLAHFFTSDPYLTLFVTTALLALVAAAQSRDLGKRHAYLLAAGSAIGLAVGSKFSAVLLLLPLAWTVWLVHRSWRQGLQWGGLALLAALATFTVTNPFALLDNSCPVVISGLPLVPDFTVGSCYLENINTQNAMVRGELDLGFTRQFAGTLPYLYFLEMQARWGLGLPLFLLALGGLGWALVTAVRAARLEHASLTRMPVVGLMILLLWIVPYVLVTGSFYVKFMRYMQPVVPPLLVLGAMSLWQLSSPRWRTATATAVLGASALYALAFANQFADPHPWNAASEWIYENVSPGTLILSEQWDDYLPVTMPVNGEVRRRSEYENAELTWLSDPDAADDEAKLAANLDLLAKADYVTVLSQRVYGVVPRLTERYLLSGQYHQLLFDGRLGYELVWVGGRAPTLFGVTLQPDLFGWPGLRPPEPVARYLDQNPGLDFGRVDESFTVYNQPLTMIFRNTGRISAAEMRAAFQPAP